MSSKPRRPTLADVAREAGLSVSGVSYALSGKGRLSAESIERARDAAKRLNYRPNVFAQSLQSQSSGLFALAMATRSGQPMPTLEVDSFRRLLQAALERSVELGCTLVVIPSTNQGDSWERIPFDGVVLIEPEPQDQLLLYARQAALPYVILGRAEQREDDEFVVDNDNVAAMRMALEHMAEQREIKRVALLAADLSRSFIESLSQALSEFCAAHGVSGERVVVPVNPAEMSEGIAGLLDRDEPVDAIFGSDEESGLIALRVALDLGLRVPEDVMIAAYSERELTYHDVSLTTVAQFPEQLGRTAIDLVVGWSRGDDVAARWVEIPTELRPRQSTTRP